jgi:hypothetical protein
VDLREGEGGMLRKGKGRKVRQGKEKTKENFIDENNIEGPQ